MSGAGKLHDICVIHTGAGITMTFITQICANVLIILKTVLLYTDSLIIPSSKH